MYSHHSIPRVRASSAEPDAVPTINLSHSLSISGSPKKFSQLAKMRRQPTVDTPSFTKEEFEDYTRVNQYKVLDIIGHVSVLYWHVQGMPFLIMSRDLMAL